LLPPKRPLRFEFILGSQKATGSVPAAFAYGKETPYGKVYCTNSNLFLSCN